MRSRYNYDWKLVSDQNVLVCPEGDDLTQQQGKDECDINLLIARVVRGEEPPAPFSRSVADLRGVPDFQSALNIMLDAEDQFMRFPSKVRRRFQNNVAEMVAFIEDPANVEEARALGLLPKPVKAPAPEEPAVAAVVAPTP